MPPPSAEERRGTRATAAEIRQLIYEAHELAWLALIYARYLRLRKLGIDHEKPVGRELSWERFKKEADRFRFFRRGR